MAGDESQPAGPACPTLAGPRPDAGRPAARRRPARGDMLLGALIVIIVFLMVVKPTF